MVRLILQWLRDGSAWSMPFLAVELLRSAGRGDYGVLAAMVSAGYASAVILGFSLILLGASDRKD